MSIKIRFVAAAFVIVTSAGCTSVAEYNVAIARDGSFAADDRQFAVDPIDYPVFELNSNNPKQDPEVGAYRGPPEMTTDILPNDRWEIIRLVYGKYIAHSATYDLRNCNEQLSGWINKCELNGRLDAPFRKYIYIDRDGSVYGWQFVNNQKMAPFEKTWFKVRNKGDWSGQPWFKCIERCDKRVNMK